MSRIPRYVRRFLADGEFTDATAANTVCRCATWFAQNGTPPDVIRGLLIDPAFDCRIPPAQFERAVDAGLLAAALTDPPPAG